MRIACVFALGLVACTSESSDVFDPYAEPPPGASGKEDGPQACGAHGEVCEPTLCGAKFNPTDRNWVTTCAPTDETSETFVKFSVTGAASANIDSRELPFVPVVPVNNELHLAVHFGCVVVPESSSLLAGPGDGVGVYFSEFEFVSWNNVPAHSRHMMYVRTNASTSDPNVYRGYAAFQENDQPATPKYGGLGMPDLCVVNIATDATGTVSGSFTCDPVPASGGAPPVAMSGEFSCPMNTLARGVWTKWQPPM
jgi:hypothetical protein